MANAHISSNLSTSFGTSSEHHTLYQYQIASTRALFAGQIQTETAYYQPNPPAPAPFTLDPKFQDPVFPASCSSGSDSSSNNISDSSSNNTSSRSSSSTSSRSSSNNISGSSQTSSGYNQTRSANIKSSSNSSNTVTSMSYSNTTKTTGQCSGWAVRILDAQDIFIYGAGLYSFFDNYNNCKYPHPPFPQKHTHRAGLTTTHKKSLFIPSIPHRLPTQHPKHRKRPEHRHLQPQHGRRDEHGRRRGGEERGERGGEYGCFPGECCCV